MKLRGEVDLPDLSRCDSESSTPRMISWLGSTRV